MKNTNSRRNFIRNAALGTAATLSIPQILSAAVAGDNGKKIKIEKDDVILFQGDSITDWGRDRSKTEANNTGSLGSGYMLLTAAQLLAKHPEKNLKIYNKGI